MDRIPCSTCKGRGSTKICLNPDADEQMREYITRDCPTCGGSGYAGIYGKQNVQSSGETVLQQDETRDIKDNGQKKQIFQRIIKYPKLFTQGISLSLEKEDSQIFLYLRNKYLFNIKSDENSMTISLKQEYKNKLAQYVLTYIKEKK